MGGVLVDLSRERSVRQFKALGVSDASDLINPYSHNGLFGSLENGDITTVIDEERAKLADYTDKLAKVSERIGTLRK